MVRDETYSFGDDFVLRMVRAYTHHCQQ